MNTKQLTWPSIKEQEQFWIDKDAVSDNATPETRRHFCPTCGLEQHSAFCNTSHLSRLDSTTADPKPKDDLSRTEATTDYYDNFYESECEREQQFRLRDAGRNPDGSGESYLERNA